MSDSPVRVSIDSWYHFLLTTRLPVSIQHVFIALQVHEYLLDVQDASNAQPAQHPEDV